MTASFRDDTSLRDFAEEAREHIITLNKDFLELEDRGRDTPLEIINEAFRAIHTIKGLSGMLGLSSINQLSHGMEDAMSAVRQGEVPLAGEFAQALFEGVDLLSSMVAAAGRGDAAEADLGPALETIASSLKRARSSVEAAPAERPAAVECVQEWQRYTDRGMTIVRVALGEQRDTPAGRAIILSSLELLEGLGEVLSVDPEDVEKKLRAKRKLKTLHTTVLFATRLTAEEMCAELRFEASAFETVASPVAERCETTEAKRGALREGAPRSGGNGEGAAGGAESVAQAIRVDVAKLDRTLALVGELVILRSRYYHVATQAISDLNKIQGASRRVMNLQSELNEVESAMSRTLSEMQDAVMKSRLVPLGSVFGRMRRTIRDTSAKRNKKVRFESSGGETELDKKVIDRIADPLLHLVRNAVDHGIEPSSDRVARGKDEEGEVTLSVKQEGDRVIIEVKDDGRGLDRRRIAMRAVERGLVAPEKVSELADHEIHALVCTPGFSTAAEVTDVSGRGVGMDVVSEAVQSLKGTLRIESQPGEGSTFRITLPLTMAIMDALLVSVGGETYAVPVGSVKEIVQLAASDIHISGDSEFFQGNDRVLPLVRLGKALGLNDASSRQSQTTVVVDSGEGQVGLTVDHVVRQQEIVVKSLSRRFERVNEISGGSVLGDGSVCLILDVPSLVERFDNEAPQLVEAGA